MNELDFSGKAVLVVGGSSGIGNGIAHAVVGDRAQVEAAGGPDALDVLVLCQGTVVYRRGEFQPEGWDRVMAVNLDSLMSCAMKFHDALAARKGVIVIVSSVSGYTSNRGNPAYAASKAGAVSLTKTLGEAWARDGIRVVGLAPGSWTPSSPRSPPNILSGGRARFGRSRWAAWGRRRTWRARPCSSPRRWPPTS